MPLQAQEKLAVDYQHPHLHEGCCSDGLPQIALHENSGHSSLLNAVEEYIRLGYSLEISLRTYSGVVEVHLISPEGSRLNFNDMSVSPELSALVDSYALHIAMEALGENNISDRIVCCGVWVVEFFRIQNRWFSHEHLVLNVWNPWCRVYVINDEWRSGWVCQPRSNWSTWVQARFFHQNNTCPQI